MSQGKWRRRREELRLGEFGVEEENLEEKKGNRNMEKKREI